MVHGDRRVAHLDAARLAAGAHLDALRQRVAQRTHARRQHQQLPLQRVADERLAEGGGDLFAADVEERLDAGAQQVVVGGLADRAQPPALDRLAAVEARQALRLGDVHAAPQRGAREHRRGAHLAAGAR